MRTLPTRDDPDGYKRRLDDAIEDRYLVAAARVILIGLDGIDDAHKIQILMNSGVAFSAHEAERAVDIINEESKTK